MFDFVLPLEKLREASTDNRERTFPEPVTLWGWFGQIVGGNASCALAVAMVQNRFEESSLPVPSAGSSSFCRARKRLLDEFLGTVEGLIGTHANARCEQWQLWRGLRTNAVDGTTFRHHDTPENQSEYPQPSGQKPGCGFPVMGVVGTLDLATGRILDVVAGPDRQHDARGLYELLDTFRDGNLVVADRAFSGYELIGLLRQRGAHAAMRLHQKREAKLDWRKGRKLSPDSRLVVWNRPAKPGSCGTTREQWEALPEEMEVRLLRVRGSGRHGEPKRMYLATTLFDEEGTRRKKSDGSKPSAGRSK